MVLKKDNKWHFWPSILIAALLTISICSLAQPNNIGIPPIRNFNNKDYRAGTQNWQITHDQKGLIYAANNEGLLEFDGNHWRTFPIANGTGLRSVEVAADGKIHYRVVDEYQSWEDGLFSVSPESSEKPFTFGDG